MPDPDDDIAARLMKRFDQHIEEAKAAVLELHAILARGCDHEPGRLAPEPEEPAAGALISFLRTQVGELQARVVELQIQLDEARKDLRPPLQIKAHFFFPGARIRVVHDDFGRLPLNALGTVIDMAPKGVKIRLDSGWEGEAEIDDLEPVNTATGPEPRVPAPSLQELQEHWDGCAGAEATINDLRAQLAELQKNSEAIRHRMTELKAELDDARSDAVATTHAVLNAAARIAREFVICAALRLPDGRVIRCHRHHHGLHVAKQMVAEAVDRRAAFEAQQERIHQGFVTSTGRYVGREEALQIQLAAGIPSVAEGGYRPRELFSEDLY